MREWCQFYYTEEQLSVLFFQSPCISAPLLPAIRMSSMETGCVIKHLSREEGKNYKGNPVKNRIRPPMLSDRRRSLSASVCTPLAMWVNCAGKTLSGLEGSASGARRWRLVGQRESLEQQEPEARRESCASRLTGRTS